MHAYRPTLTGTRHMISAGHHAAAHAGFTILEAGGNAVDAGVAAGIALSVLQTDLVNFAGVAPMMIYLADTREVVNIDGLGTWPQAADINVFIQQHGGKMPPGILRTVIPAAPDAWITALEKYGTMGFGEVAQAAIRFARDGFAMHWLMAGFIQQNEAEYRRFVRAVGLRFVVIGEAQQDVNVFARCDRLIAAELAEKRRQPALHVAAADLPPHQSRYDHNG